MIVKEIILTDDIVEKLIHLSTEWQNEDISYGYRANGKEDIIDKHVFVIEENNEIMAYLFGHIKKQENDTSVIKKDTTYFEIDELYVQKMYRSLGLGKKLYHYLEDKLKKENIHYILLTTSTKNYKSVLHFYIEEIGMEFWSARLFKKI